MLAIFVDDAFGHFGVECHFRTTHIAHDEAWTPQKCSHNTTTTKMLCLRLRNREHDAEQCHVRHEIRPPLALPCSASGELQARMGGQDTSLRVNHWQPVPRLAGHMMISRYHLVHVGATGSSVLHVFQEACNFQAYRFLEVCVTVFF